MAEGGYKKQLWRSRALRPGDSTASTNTFKTAVRGAAVPGGRVKMGMTPTTAPHKDQIQHFENKNGFDIGFGLTGLRGDS